MSAELKNLDGIKNFLEKLEKVPEFRKKFEDFMTNAHQDNSKDLLAEMATFANAEGFACSIGDLAMIMHKTAASLSGELSDEELAAAAGGGVFLNGIMSAVRNIFAAVSKMGEVFQKIIQDLPKRIVDIIPK
ncbi:MAG: hypothetical protein A2017_13710 [Lentisphaerae bacterium GWF2_44_16]|nr:MAG: hypothetical protein A2017_13710 [Lentisphaerae bacterium GWF2_44_16]